MDISWESTQLLAQSHIAHALPGRDFNFLQNCGNGEYIDAIANLALSPDLTTTIITIYDSISVEICGRWLANTGVDQCLALSAVTRVVACRPHLKVFARNLLTSPRDAVIVALASRKATALQDVQTENLHDLLLSVYRLLAFNNADFAPYVSPAQLQSLLGHDSRPVRYMAIRILCSYLHTSDATSMAMVERYLGTGNIEGHWEGKVIDYAFLDLWEERRLKDLAKQFKQMEVVRSAQRDLPHHKSVIRIIGPGDISATSACIGGVLVPRHNSSRQDPRSLVMTTTTCRDLAALAKGINSGHPLLLSGFEGSGKTSMIKYVSRILGADSSMVTLHLNDQTDAKSLIGMYTNSKNPGSFRWQPGILTKAVREGRWIVIEEIDRAPAEILSTLLPLLERRELFIPNWGESIQAAPGFKLIATVRSYENIRGEVVDPIVNLIGRRLWSRIAVGPKTDLELAAIIEHKNPILHAYIPRMMAVYSAVRSANVHSGSTVKPAGPRDLLRWGARVQDLVLAAGASTGNEPMSEATSDKIYLEAADCFAAALSNRSLKGHLMHIIAQELQMPAKRVEHCLHTRVAQFQDLNTVLSVGRVRLPKRGQSPIAVSARLTASKGPFSITEHVSGILESVAAVVKRAEPCLLVGETGTGKTTIIQELASSLNQHLTVINLSQQSEAGDLLGGFKPVSMRRLATPMKEAFDDLLQSTFPSKSNQQYVLLVEKAVFKERWSRALSLWQEALQTIRNHLDGLLANPQMGNDQPRSKKRKLRTTNYAQLKSRWDRFATDVQLFQNHLSSGDKGFAFSFVESNIVKAAREGNWVLLDEINLAPMDTLESLADLLCDEQEGGPSLLLPEVGDLGRVQAHKDFRIFGTMNPATDAGKRDLPPNIRSRFTEIFVEAPDKDLSNLVPIVKAYLGSHTHVYVRLATEIAQLYLEIKKLSDENKLADGTDQKTHFSLRTLTRTLSYATDIAPVYGLRQALFEGFCMCFLTILNKPSEVLLQPLIRQRIVGSQNPEKTPRVPQDGKQYISFRQYWVLKGPVSVEQQPHYVITPFIERNLLNLVRATSTRKFPVLLQGPTSSGKTSMIEHLAKISGNKFVRINNHEHTDLQEYLGSYVSGPDGRLHFQEGLLVEALREGHWIVLDELNLAPTDVLEALNRLLDDNRELLIPETQQIVRPHENFMLFATQNPAGLYGGRKVLSRAFRNRFLELHFDDIPDDELETILRERSQIAPSFCRRIVSVYQKLSILRQTTRLFEQRNSFATLRDLFRWALRDADDREQLAANGYMLLGERVRDPDERIIVKKVIEEVMKVKIDEGQIYGMRSVEESLGSPLPAPLGITWTKSMRRLYTLVSHALEHREPVLLVGDTGCGKTTICQVIAETMHAKLHMVNAHQNMETGDLIGSQRPIRDRALVKLQLSDALAAALEGSGRYNFTLQTDINTLIKQYETLIQEAPDSVPNQVRSHIERSRAKANALFEWADGSLVQAMRDGHHYLLDEISLADDSVLERLNSVLEPDRSLLLAEKGSNDVQVKASPGFQFLATMNPGGDYGKRELSPALRNRFTEIWVPSITDDEEMLEIVQAKLPPSRASLAKPMVKFATWYGSIYKTNAPTVSIRDLLTWTKFIDIFQSSSPNFSILHGAAMVYLDRLSARPTAQASIVDSSTAPEVSKCLQNLSDLFDYDMSSMYGESPTFNLNSHQLEIGDFNLKRKLDEAPRFQYSLQAPTTKLNTMKIVRALQLSRPILLEGNPGVGKTTLVSALAESIGMVLTRINLSEQTDLMDLFGSDIPIEGEDAGHFGWRDAPFLRAMQKGEWVLLDEMNLASQTVLEGLNACLDHRGQVYIPELDRSFSRHADFVIFAAQNPHSQGGGRKGLPESFVNRFTSVYAREFSKQDLMTICTELFPKVSTEITESLVNCIGNLNSSLQRDVRLGAYGGPWEFNLRDIVRWLQLLTSDRGLLALARPVDFVNLLFVQRFRTVEDRAIIAKIFEEQLHQNEVYNSHYHANSPSVLQVGFALLSKDKVLQSSPGLDQVTHPTNSSITESLMLCVQESWPCLLVGVSGSGKTAAIMQLAASVGAELIQVSLNSEMDTLDLVGGYEQLDAERRIIGFIKRVKAYTRKVTAERLISASERDDEYLVWLEAMSEANLPGLLQQLQLAARCNSSSEFPALLAECQDLAQLSVTDNRARFEWVDGIIVKALKQGKWLVLDNANLCSPAVLDRLNSLLEPNGLLSINEHRDSDGRPQIVKPHSEFRLFMTMDPRHGELSRAMRNRSLELFMPTAAPCPAVDISGSHIECTFSRFQFFQAFDWNELDDIQFKYMLSIFLEHLSFSDFRICTLWQEQLLLGLIDVPSSKLVLFQSVLSIYQNLLASRHVVIENIQSSYIVIGNELGFTQDFSNLQPIQPFNNSLLLFTRTPMSMQLECLGRHFDLLIEINVFQQRLAGVVRSVGSKTLTQMTRLERSLSATSSRTIKDETSQHVGTFLQDMSSYLSGLLNKVDGASIARSRVTALNDGISEHYQAYLSFLQTTEEVITYLNNLLEVTHVDNFDEGIFHAFEDLGESLLADRNREKHLIKPASELLEGLASKFDVLKTVGKPCSGLAIERLWAALKPPTAACTDHLEMHLKMEALADRFDDLKWRSGASLKNLIDLHASLVAVHASFSSQETLNVATLEKMKLALEDMTHQSHLNEGNTAPYFQMQFAILAQNSVLDPNGSSPTAQPMLDMLAGRPTRTSMVIGIPSFGWSSLSQNLPFTSWDPGVSDLGSVRQVFSISALKKLSQLHEVPLRSLSLLVDEINSLSQMTANTCKTFSNDPVPQFYQRLGALRSVVAQSLESVEDSGGVLAYTPRVADLSTRLIGKATMNSKAIVEQQSALLRCSMEVCTSPQSSRGERNRDSMLQLAEDWIQCFAGLLLLYVPDRLVDPVLRLSVERECHKKRKTKLQGKLAALKTFERKFSGEQSNYRMHLLRNQLDSMGVEPAVPLIPRPAISQLELLQGEFNNILKTIVLRLPNPYKLKEVAWGNTPIQQELELLRMNIAKATSRVSTGFRAYDDITMPVAAMLKGLDVGLGLTVLAGRQKSSVEEAIVHISNMTPFLGANPRLMAKESFKDLKDIAVTGIDPRPRFLECIALVKGVNSEIDGEPLRAMFETFHSFYEKWKEELKQDQTKTALNSSLYRYRGSQEDEENFDEVEFMQLFPTYDVLDNDRKASHQSTEDPSHLAQRIAYLHREAFQSDRTTKNKVLGMIESASSEIADLWSDDVKNSTLPVPIEMILPALILSLGKAGESLQSQSQNQLGKIYNFYTDPNLIEAQKIVALVKKIQARFCELQEAWPEHATLEDVLRTSSELLSLRHSEPIAKILTKTEKLHGFVHEWQVVASREFSVIDLYDSLSALLVSWRRLELSTWGRLLDMEDKHCVEDSDHWWFVAYEVIVAAPMSMIDGQQTMQEYAQQLVQLLRDFLGTTSLGQYAPRLKMIKSFEHHTELLSKEHEGFGLVRNALANFLRYHHHFDEPIRQKLQSERQKLEKGMKDILLLASWKDTNIVALRDSAKRSHHKLFKVVRKYRSLLAQPAANILQQRIADPEERVDVGVSSGSVHSARKVDLRALQLCKEKLNGWSSKPMRQLRPDDTTRNMLRISQVPPTAIDGAAHLESFATDLAERIKGLQSETPTKVSKENLDAFKHLKTRKRNLYAETLKAVRLMGFRSNLGADVLKRQDSIEAVLSSALSFRNPAQTDLAQADHYLDVFLNVLPEARENATKHSADLTNGEASRSLGYLESMLSTIVKQRATLARALDDFRTFEEISVTMRNLWAPDTYIIRPHSVTDERSANELNSVIKWLPDILEVGCTIVQVHGKLGETVTSEVLDCLQQWRVNFIKSGKAVADLARVPCGLSTSEHLEVTIQHSVKLKAFRAQLHKFAKSLPNMAYIFKQIERWTSSEKAEEEHNSNGTAHSTILNFDASISQVVNATLVALQHMNEALLSIPSTVENPQWLLSLDTSLSNSLRSLRSQEIGHMLSEAIPQIKHLDTVDSDNFLVASAICGATLPIVQQYVHIQRISLERYARLHVNVCRVASILAKAFSQVAQDGFCSPPESSGSEQDNARLEGGTGLGEGEGAEDISKDIQDGEDMSELAQQNKEEKEAQDIQDQDDAVDMNHDEMEGEMKDTSGQSDGENTSDAGNDSDMDEETGDVDDLDNEAVDEQLWDGKGAEDQKEKQGNNPKKETDGDGVAAAEGKVKEADDGEANEELQAEEPDPSEDGDVEDEEVAQQEIENLDPHVQEGQHLDLPEEMDLDNVDSSQGCPSDDEEMERLSDVEHKQDDAELMTDDADLQMEDDADKQAVLDDEGQAGKTEDDDQASRNESPVDTDPEDEDILQEDREEIAANRTDDVGPDVENVAPSDTQGLGNSNEQMQDKTEIQASRAQSSEGVEGAPDVQNGAQGAGKGDETSNSSGEARDAQAKDDVSRQEQSSQPFKKLGDVLKQWHKQHKQIQDGSSPEGKEPFQEAGDLHADFEHLGENDEESDIQALGAASKEQARPLDDTAIDPEMQEERQKVDLQHDSAEDAGDEDKDMEDAEEVQTSSQKLREQSGSSAFIGKDARKEPQDRESNRVIPSDDVMSIEDLDNDLAMTRLQPYGESSHKSIEEAQRLWSHYEALTRDLSLALTERLRLILAPTHATRMRGDFRTGKRLNIKRIIPYIASNFKRDKIWMRRSIPTKRTYQIMLAVDDSRSMSESQSGQLAYQTLALVARSLSMLEAGEICVVGFGNNVFVAHEFDTPFSAEAGATIMQRFNYQQEGTNVRKLVGESIKLFRQARTRSSISSQELWQLELIISDGVCEDHESIKMLVRQAAEERIMIVFVIVDALLKDESIVDMSQAIFEPDSATGTTKLKMKRYLDGFPFTYYLVVGDVGELPSILAQALRQWFAEVSEG